MWGLQWPPLSQQHHLVTLSPHRRANYYGVKGYPRDGKGGCSSFQKGEAAKASVYKDAVPGCPSVWEKEDDPYLSRELRNELCEHRRPSLKQGNGPVLS